MKYLPLLFLLLFFSASTSSAGSPGGIFFSVGRAADYRALPPADAVTIEVPEEEEHASAVPDLLSSAAPLSVRRLNGAEGLATVSMRGFRAKQTAVFLDDVRLPADITGTVDLSLLPVAGLGRVEVLPGAAAASYGANAEGGVVQLFTRRLSPGARLAEASAGMSSYGTGSYTLKAGAAGKAGDFFVGGTNSSARGFQQNSDTEREGLQGRAALKLGPAGSLTLNGLYSRLRTGLPSGTPVPLSDWDGSREKAANSLTDWQASRRGFLAASWAAGAGRVSARLDSSVSVNRIEACQFGSLSDSRITDRSLSGRVIVDNTLVLGAEGTVSRLDSGTYGDRRLGATGFFAQKTFRAAEGLEITPAARLDGGGAYDRRLSQKLSAVYAPDGEWQFSASAGTAFQPPTFADLYNPWAAPAPGLKPERSVNYSAAAAYGSPAGWKASLSGYYSEIKDRIALDPATWAAANLDRGFNYGLEASASWLPGDLRLSAGYALNVSKVSTGGAGYELLNYSPLRRISLSAAWVPGEYALRLKGAGVSEQYTARAGGGLRMPEYWVFGLSASRNFEGLKLWAAVDNVLDRHYAGTADAFNGWYPQPGRTFSAGLTWRLL